VKLSNQTTKIHFKCIFLRMDVCGHGPPGVKPYLVQGILVDYSSRKNVEISSNSGSIILPVESVPNLIHSLFVMYDLFNIEPHNGLVKVYEDVGKVIYPTHYPKDEKKRPCVCVIKKMDQIVVDGKTFYSNKKKRFLNCV